MPEYQINLALMHALAFILAGIACISDLRSRRSLWQRLAPGNR